MSLQPHLVRKYSVPCDFLTKKAAKEAVTKSAIEDRIVDFAKQVKIDSASRQMPDLPSPSFLQSQPILHQNSSAFRGYPILHEESLNFGASEGLYGPAYHTQRNKRPVAVEIAPVPTHEKVVLSLSTAPALASPSATPAVAPGGNAEVSRTSAVTNSPVDDPQDARSEQQMPMYLHDYTGNFANNDAATRYEATNAGILPLKESEKISQSMSRSASRQCATDEVAKPKVGEIVMKQSVQPNCVPYDPYSQPVSYLHQVCQVLLGSDLNSRPRFDLIRKENSCKLTKLRPYSSHRLPS